jgi:hypothetical protein
MPEASSSNANDVRVPQRRSRHSRWIPAAGAGAALLVLAATTVPTLLLNHPGTPATPASHQKPAAPGTSPAPSASTTADQLRALADALHTGPADTQSGPYTYHHIRRWILDTTGTPAPRPNTAAVFAVEIHRWEAADGSGLGTETQLDPDYHLTAADPNHRSTNTEFAGAHPVRTTYPAGNLSSPIRGPLATDPAALARQLAVDPLPPGPQWPLLAIDEVYTAHYLSAPVRAAALRVLADVPGLGYHPSATDRLGRPGIAVSLDNRNIRYSLIFDAATGQLLASEQRLIAPHEHLSVPAGLVTYYTLFVDQGRRANLSQVTAP